MPRQAWQTLAHLGFMAALAIFVVWPLLATGGWYASHERDWYVLRLFALDQMLADGQDTIRWCPIMYQGYGYPFFNFYPPVTYFLAEGFHLLGLSEVASYTALLLGLTFVQQVFLYLFVRARWGAAAGLVAAVAYTLAPYHFANLYWRGALAEYAACALFPMSLYLFHRFLATGSALAWLGATASQGLLVATHNISALLFTAILGATVVFEWVVRPAVRPRVLAAMGSLAGALVVSAGAWMPAFFEKDLVTLDRNLAGWFDFNKHFLPARRIVLSLPGDGEPLLTVGLPGVLGVLAAGVLAVAGRLKERATLWFYLVVGLAAAFLITSWSAWIWPRVPLLPFLQFPWRFLMVASLAGAIVGSTWLSAVPQARGLRIAAAAVAIVALLAIQGPGIGFFRPQTVDPAHLTLSYFLENKEITSFDEYTPRTVPKDPPHRTGHARLAKGRGRILDANRDGVAYTIGVETQGPAVVQVAVFFHPGWVATVDGVPVDIRPDADGLIEVPVPGGPADVTVRYRGTVLETAGSVVSLVSVLLLAMAAVAVPLIRRRRLRQHTLPPS
jgi:hypothetical protein